MKKTTLIVLLSFAALLTAVLLMERKSDDGQSGALTIPGFLEDAATAAKTTADLKDPGFERIVIERAGRRIVLTKTKEKDEDVWRMTEPADARVEQFKVKQMLLPMQTPTESLFSKVYKEEDLALYGLAENEATSVELFQDGKPWASFLVGSSEKAEDPEAGADEIDTWVMEKSGKQIFRMGGKDLHAPFAIEVNDLRDKKLFEFEKADIQKLTLRNPADETDPEIVMVDRAPAPPKAEGETPAPASEGDWAFEKPANRSLGSLSALLAGLSGLRVAEYVGLDAAADAGLGEGDNPFEIVAELRDGTTVTLILGKEDGANTWATLKGAKEAYKISKYTASTLRKTVNELREKKVLGLKADQIERITLPGAELEIERIGDQWGAVRPAGFELGTDEVATLLRDIEGFAVADFVAPPPPVDQTGLDPATAKRILMKTAGGEVALLIGSEADGKTWMAQVGDASEVWKVTSYTAKKLERTQEDLRDKQVLTFPREAMARIALQKGTGGATTELERDPGETDPAKSWKIVVPTGMGGDATKIGALVTTLVNLKAKTLVQDKGFAEAGLTPETAFRLTVTLTDGTSTEILISDDQYQGDNYAVVTNGATWRRKTFTVNQYQAKNLMKSATDLTQ